MLGKFLKFLLSEAVDSEMPRKGYAPIFGGDSPGTYIDGLFVDGKVAKMTDAELMIPAEKARVLAVSSIDEVRTKARRKIFQMIHSAIKQGKVKIRIEENNVKSETLEYFTSIGYNVERVTPPAGNNDFNEGNVFTRDDDGEDIPGTEHPYFYYSLTWGDSAPSTTTQTTSTEVVPVITTT